MSINSHGIVAIIELEEGGVCATCSRKVSKVHKAYYKNGSVRLYCAGCIETTNNESNTALDEKSKKKKTNSALTPREHEVLQQLIQGLSNKEIAQELFIKKKTVNGHLNSIFKKFHVSRRIEAILKALKEGI
jgi:DNA-binding NarL/FixJ family response regulator